VRIGAKDVTVPAKSASGIGPVIASSGFECAAIDPLIILTKWSHMGTIGTMKKVRTVIYLEEPERRSLEALSKKTGAPLTELVRRAVVDYLKRQT
jgi:hypothetical protein